MFCALLQQNVIVGEALLFRQKARHVVQLSFTISKMRIAIRQAATDSAPSSVLFAKTPPELD